MSNAEHLVAEGIAKVQTIQSAEGKVQAEHTSIAPVALDLYRRLRDLDLLQHVAEAEILGYTVIPPEKAMPAGLAVRLREAILDVSQRRFGVRPNLDLGSEHARPESFFGHVHPYMLFEDPVFEEAFTNPVRRVLSDYFVGANATVHNCIAIVKGPGGSDLPLHADNALFPPPFPVQPHILNVTYALTDYTRANGALAFVPGSHRYFRGPIRDEAIDQRVPVECPAGSLIVWTGHCWHGAFGRTNPGLRVNLLTTTIRAHMRVQEAYRENVPPEVLARNPPFFAKLMGKHINFGWKEEGPQNEDTAYNIGNHYYD